jgi:glycosyltransferase involved in cell wall biosynthesis
VGPRLAIFGVFYPEFQFAGNSSTGLLLLLEESTQVSHLTVFPQRGAILPLRHNSSRVDLVPTWSLGNPLSIITTWATMLRFRASLDGYVFNIYVTSFGRSRLANLLGLLVPSLLALLGGKPVLVYMHNMVETQDVGKLGYSPSRLALASVRIAESLLLKTTRVVVPLESQSAQVAQRLGIRPRSLMLPFVDTVLAVQSFLSDDSPGRIQDSGVGGPFRILLLGTWGPQKDLRGALLKVRHARARGLSISAHVVGEVNSHHPAYDAEFQRLQKEFTNEAIRFSGKVPEDQLIATLLAHDAVLLPYVATGGYSGTMNLAAVSGLPIIAYDLPQLREMATAMGISVKFVGAESDEEFLKALGELITEKQQCSWKNGLDARLRTNLAAAIAAVEKLIEMI